MINSGMPSLVSAAFVAITELFAPLRPFLWRQWYDHLAQSDPDGMMQFMNYGYAENNPSCPEIHIEGIDKQFSPSAQLYAQVVRELDLREKHVLEIGCGRGGGSFLARTHALASYIGVDLSSAAIKRAKRSFALPNVEWVCASADMIPLPESSIDIVINVESSHCYPSMRGFLHECRFLLRPGGSLALADFRLANDVERLERQFEEAQFRICERREITAQVLHALDRLAIVRADYISTQVPFYLRSTFRDFAALPGTVIYEGFSSGKFRYFRYLLERA
jgi:SAM-dependent methyltransferase